MCIDLEKEINKKEKYVTSLRQGTYFSHINTIESIYFFIIYDKSFIFNSKIKIY